MTRVPAWLDTSRVSGSQHDGDPSTYRRVRVPVIHRLGPYRFFFYSDENRETDEPPHVHVWSSGRVATFWLAPVSLRDARGYTPREIERIRRIVVGSREMMLRRWHEYFDHLA